MISESRSRIPAGLWALIAFFAFGACMSAISAIGLATPGGILDPMWSLNPDAHRRLASLGAWGITIMALVSLACVTTAFAIAYLASRGVRGRLKH